MAPTAWHFLRRNFRPQERSSLRTSHSGVCRHAPGHLFYAAWILIHRWARLASSFVGPSSSLCCTIVPLQVDADVSVLRQGKDFWRVSRFHGDGFWLSVPIFVGDLVHLMLFLLLSWCGFSSEVPGCSNLLLLKWSSVDQSVDGQLLNRIFTWSCVNVSFTQTLRKVIFGKNVGCCVSFLAEYNIQLMNSVHSEYIHNR